MSIEDKLDETAWASMGDDQRIELVWPIVWSAAIALRIEGDINEVADVAQEAVPAVLRAMMSWRHGSGLRAGGRGEALSSWVWRAVRESAVNHRRLGPCGIKGYAWASAFGDRTSRRRPSARLRRRMASALGRPIELDAMHATDGQREGAWLELCDPTAERPDEAVAEADERDRSRRLASDIVQAAIGRMSTLEALAIWTEMDHGMSSSQAASAVHGRPIYCTDPEARQVENARRRAKEKIRLAALAANYGRARR